MEIKIKGRDQVLIVNSKDNFHPKRCHRDIYWKIIMDDKSVYFVHASDIEMIHASEVELDGNPELETLVDSLMAEKSRK